jgi:hypothetical protein
MGSANPLGNCGRWRDFYLARHASSTITIQWIVFAMIRFMLQALRVVFDWIVPFAVIPTST